MADSPWIKFYTSDYLTGVADLQAEEIGVYTIVLALIWDKGGPIQDDSAWLARRAGTSTRRFNQIRAHLIDLGKLEARNGLLANRRALEELAKRDGKSAQARSAAMVRWRQEGEPELPLAPDDAQDGTDIAPRTRVRSGNYLAKNTGKNSRNSQDKDVLISGKNDKKPQKAAIPDDADACFPSRARAFQKLEVRNTPQHTTPLEPARVSRLDDADLKKLFDAVCDAAAMRPLYPDAINRTFTTIQEWQAEGFDFTEVVIPTIIAVVAKSEEPTRLLSRFTPHIRTAQARLTRNGAKPAPPVKPRTEEEKRDDTTRLIALYRRMGRHEEADELQQGLE